MVTASGTRIGWSDLPAPVREAVEQIVGGPVVEARSQPGGFSPGTADRVVTASGARAFVKAVSPDQNADTPALHRREALITAALPAGAPVPRLLGTYDDGHWIVLVLSDVEGRHPVTPWAATELRQVNAALERLAVATTPAPLADLVPAPEAASEEFAGWERVRADLPVHLDPWAAAHLDDLCAAAARGRAATAGNTLVHLDVRADNLLLGPDGTVTVVDWPWACRGAAWLDRAMLLVNVQLYGGHDLGAQLADLAAGTGASVDDLVAVLTGLAGYFTDMARRPAPPGLPTVRAFQQAQADALLSWLRVQPG